MAGRRGIPTDLADEAAPAGEAVAQAIARLLPIVQDALDDDWTLATMAARAGYEAHHFAHAFRAAVGVPPVAYVRHLRLERAAHDLVFARDKPLVDVQLEAGYASAEAFRRAFVRAFGGPPSSFRGPRRARRPPRARADALARPAWLERPPELVDLGPLRACSLTAASFDGHGIATAWRDFLPAIQAAGARPARWSLGAATSPWGWVRDSRRREYRCLYIDPPPRRPIAAPLSRWQTHAGWCARFDYEGAQDGLFELFTWVFTAWLPAAALRWRFAPVVTLYDHERWYATRFAEASARVFVPVNAQRG